uniref:neuropeptide Y receptor type 1-like isoform X1 n=1 Tax=Styela clava TaxID=7725 RepID=UPI00193974AA|nr:neuropeptide Y receptor type 1-like isoform X1 [Styela clava]
MSILVESKVNVTEHPIIMNSTAMDGTTTPYDYLVDQNKLFTFAGAVTVTTVLGILSLFGMFANLITFIVILRMKKTIFSIILASLCLSDFLSALDSPFVIYRSTFGYRYYEASEAVCKIAQAVDFWTTILTIQHILIFAILRLISVSNPHKFRKVNTKHATFIVAFIWIETLLVGFVCFVLWPGVHMPPAHAFGGRSCRMQRKWVPMAMIYSIYIFPILLYLPMLLVVVVCVILCIVILRKRFKSSGENFSITHRRSANTEKKENYALLQLTLIVASFLFGYIPDISYRATAIISKSRKAPLTPRVEWLYSVIAHCLLRISECLNPIFYNLGSSSKMRRATFAFLRKCAHLTPTVGSRSSKSISSSRSGNPSTPQLATTRI